MKSGEKELCFNHYAIYKLESRTGKGIIEFTDELTKGKMGALYELLFAALEGYKDIKELCDDIPANGIVKLSEAVTKSLGFLLEDLNENTEEENVKK